LWRLECAGMIGSERPPEALAQYTGFLMSWVARRSRERFAEALEAEVGLHPREFGVLAVVQRDPGITQQAIGEAAGVDPSTMVATLDSLEARGLAERRPHASDRRKRAVFLTTKGEDATHRAQRVGRQVGKETLGALTDDERGQLNGLLRKLAGLEPAT
jgi:DNA-binding MarR family transcriptional regulator